MLNFETRLSTKPRMTVGVKAYTSSGRVHWAAEGVVSKVKLPSKSFCFSNKENPINQSHARYREWGEHLRMMIIRPSV